MKTWWLLPLISALATSAWSQAMPASVSVCDLLGNPGAYDMRVVQVRGMIELAFEIFTIEHPPCGTDDLPGVWLEYGGDESTPATYCCGDHRRAKGSIFEIRGKSVPLKRDASFEEFTKRLLARRVRRPDGTFCEGRECYFYNVTATMTGLFVAGDAKNALPGYGHLGCCHLLVIQAVSDVQMERTPTPAGGSFACKAENWTARTEQVGWMDNSREYRSAARNVLSNVARHWDDSVDVSSGTLSCWTDATKTPNTSHCNWTAPDLLTTYELTSMSERPAAVLVSRRRCESVSPSEQPWLTRAPIRCDSYEWKDEAESTAAAVNKMVDTGREPWRRTDFQRVAETALRSAVEKWKIVMPAAPIDCEEPFVNDEEHVYVTACYWRSADGMSEFGVTMRKFKVEGRTWDQVPLLPTRVAAWVCRAE